jgi:hypothetical protein
MLPSDAAQGLGVRGRDALHQALECFRTVDVADDGGILGNAGELGGLGDVNLRGNETRQGLARLNSGNAHAPDGAHVLVNLDGGIARSLADLLDDNTERFKAGGKLERFGRFFDDYTQPLKCGSCHLCLNRRL